MEDACIEIAVARQLQLIELIERHEAAAMGGGLELLMQCGVEFRARDLAVAIQSKSAQKLPRPREPPVPRLRPPEVPNELLLPRGGGGAFE